MLLLDRFFSVFAINSNLQINQSKINELYYYGLPHQFKLYLNASFYSGGNENIYLYKPSSNIQAGLQKEIFIKNLIASLWLVDCFKTDTENYTYNISNITQKINSYNATRMLMFSLTYQFNSAESRYKNSRSGIEERQRL